MMDYFLNFGLLLIDGHGTNKKAAEINFQLKESLQIVSPLTCCLDCLCGCSGPEL
jgi:hypothetical protein